MVLTPGLARLAALASMVVVLGVLVVGIGEVPNSKPWHGPDAHSPIPHAAHGGTSLTQSAQPTGQAAFLLPAPWRSSHEEPDSSQGRLETRRVDHPPRLASADMRHA